MRSRFCRCRSAAERGGGYSTHPRAYRCGVGQQRGFRSRDRLCRRRQQGSKPCAPFRDSRVRSADLRDYAVEKFRPPTGRHGGLRHASGDIVAVIDADLQDPVELIPEMVTNGGRATRSFMASAAIAKSQSRWSFVTASFIGCCRAFADRGTKNSGDFCCSIVSRSTPSTGFPKRTASCAGFAPGMAAGKSDSHTIGRSVPRDVGYSLGKLLNLAVDGIFNFSVLPLDLFFGLGSARRFSLCWGYCSFWRTGSSASGISAIPRPTSPVSRA